MIFENLEVAPSGAVMGFLLKTLVTFFGGVSSAGLLDAVVLRLVSGVATWVLVTDLSEGEAGVLLEPPAVLMMAVLLDAGRFFKMTTLLPDTFFCCVTGTLLFWAAVEGAAGLFDLNAGAVEDGFVLTIVVTFLVTGFV